MSARKLLLFRTGGRVFAIDAGAVREILPATPPTRIPGSPAAVRGLVNVRGTLVTVVDAALAVGVRDAPSSGDTGNGTAAPTLVLVEQGTRTIGLIVDDVLDLVSVGDGALAAGGPFPGVRPEMVAATGLAAGEPFAQLAADVLLESVLA
jgi:purine-binding chemotaxis protein CheW